MEQAWTTASDTVPKRDDTTIFDAGTVLAMFKYTKEDGTVYYSSFTENGDSVIVTSTSYAFSISGITNPVEANGNYIEQSTGVYKNETNEYYVSRDGIANYWCLSPLKNPSSPAYANFFINDSSITNPWDATLWSTNPTNTPPYSGAGTLVLTKGGNSGGESESVNGIEIYEASDGRLLLGTVIHSGIEFPYIYPPTIYKSSLPRLTDITSPVPYMRDADINMIIIPAGYTSLYDSNITYNIVPGLGVSVTLPPPIEETVSSLFYMILDSVSVYPVYKEPGLVLEVVSGSLATRLDAPGITVNIDSSIGAIRLEKRSGSAKNEYYYDGTNEMLNNIGIASANAFYIIEHPVSGKPALYIGGSMYATLGDSFDDLMAGYTYTNGSLTLQITQDYSL